MVWLAVVSGALASFFSLASYSLRELRRLQLEEAFGVNRAPDNSRGRKRLDLLERHLMPLRMTAALCRSLSNLVMVIALMSVFGAAADQWEPLAKACAVAGVVIAVFGVAIPHAWSSHAGEKVLAVTLEALMAFRMALWPLVAVMIALGAPFRRLSVANPRQGPADAAKQEILQAVSEGRAGGAVNAEELHMIESVMDFGQMQAGEIMTPRTDIIALPAGTAWADACKQVYESGHTRVPIFEGDLDNIVGVLYAKDLFQYVGANPPADLRGIMRKPFFVPETKRLGDLLREFKARKVHIAVVLDEYGGTAGLVSFEDVLEEIVGDISDEYDTPSAALLRRMDERTVEADGRTYIDDLNKAVGLRLPQDAGYDTLAGFLFSELGYIPSAGETLDTHGAKFTIIAADERRITRVKVELLTGRQGED